jgi:hypothetical protein
MRFSFFASLFAVSAVTFFAGTRDAHALGPVGIEIAAKGGGASNPSDVSVSPLGFGVGGRAGVEVLNFYAGASALYYFGHGVDYADFSASSHSVLYGVEAGYGFKLLDDHLTIRPLLGIGNAHVSYDEPGYVHTSYSSLYLEPGVTVLVGLGSAFVGADANLLVIPNAIEGDVSVGYKSFSLHGQVGIKF